MASTASPPYAAPSCCESDYARLYDCIVSGQVPPRQCQEYLRDDAFHAYYASRRQPRDDLRLP